MRNGASPSLGAAIRETVTTFVGSWEAQRSKGYTRIAPRPRGSLGRLLPRPFVSTCWGFSSSSLPRLFVSRCWPFCHRAVPFSSFASSATGIFCYRHLFPGSLAQSSTIDGHRLPVRLGLALAVVLRLLRRYLASPLDGGLPTVPLSPFLRAFGRPSGCWVVLEQPLDNATWCEWVGYVPG